jgi:predicted RND superfamily exporter protein
MITALFVGKKYSLYLAVMLTVLISVFMFFNMDDIREKLGFETVASLKVEIEKQNKIIEDMKAVVVSKDKEVTILQNRITTTEKLSLELTTELTKRDKNVTMVVSKRDKKIRDLQKEKGIKDLEGLNTESGVTETIIEDYKHKVS